MGNPRYLLLLLFVLFIPHYNNTTSTVVIPSQSTSPELFRIPIPSSYYAVAYDGQDYWLGDYSSMIRINKTTGATLQTITNSSRRHDAIGYFDGLFWATSTDYLHLIGFDLNGTEERIFDHPWSKLDSFAFGNDEVYLYDSSNSRIYVLNYTDGTQLRDFAINTNSIDFIAYSDNMIWLSSTSTSYQDIYGISPVDGRRLTWGELSDSGAYRGMVVNSTSLAIVKSDENALVFYDISGLPSLNIYPDMDTYVQSSSTNIYGLDIVLSASDTQIAYFRFPLDQLSTVDTALLTFYNYATDIVPIYAYGVVNDAWDELTMTYSNRVGVGDYLDTANLVGVNWYTWNVTDFVKTQNDGYATIALKTSSTSGHLRGYTKDSSNQGQWPYLAVNGSVFYNPVVNQPAVTTTTRISDHTVTQTSTTSVVQVQTHTTTQTIAETTITQVQPTTQTTTHEQTITSVSTSNSGNQVMLVPVIGALIAVFVSKRRFSKSQ